MKHFQRFGDVNLFLHDANRTEPNHTRLRAVILELTIASSRNPGAFIAPSCKADFHLPHFILRKDYCWVLPVFYRHITPAAGGGGIQDSPGFVFTFCVLKQVFHATIPYISAPTGSGLPKLQSRLWTKVPRVLA